MSLAETPAVILLSILVTLTLGCPSVEISRPSSQYPVFGEDAISLTINLTSTVVVQATFWLLSSDADSFAMELPLHHSGSVSLPPPRTSQGGRSDIWSESSPSEVWDLNIQLLEAVSNVDGTVDGAAPITCDGVPVSTRRVIHFFPIRCELDPACVDPLPPVPLPSWPLSPWRAEATFVYSLGALSMDASGEDLNEPLRFYKWLSRVGFQEGGVATDVVVVLDGTPEENQILRADKILQQRSRAVRVVRPKLEGYVVNPFIIGALLSRGDFIFVPSLEDLSNRRMAAESVDFFRRRNTILFTQSGGMSRILAVPKSILTSTPVGFPRASFAHTTAHPQALLLGLSELPLYVRPPSSLHCVQPGVQGMMKEFMQRMLDAITPRISELNMGENYDIQSLVEPQHSFLKPLQCSVRLAGLNTTLPLSLSPAAWLLPCCLLSGVGESSVLFLTSYASEAPEALLHVAAQHVASPTLCNFHERPLSTASSASTFLGPIAKKYGTNFYRPTGHPGHEDDATHGVPSEALPLCAYLRAIFTEPYNQESLWGLANLPLGLSHPISAIASAIPFSRMITHAHSDFRRSEARFPRQNISDEVVVSHLGRIARITAEMALHVCSREAVDLTMSALALASVHGRGSLPATYDKLARQPNLLEWIRLGWLREGVVSVGGNGISGSTPGHTGPYRAGEYPYLDVVSLTDGIRTLHPRAGYLGKYSSPTEVTNLWDPWSSDLELSSWATRLSDSPDIRLWPSPFWDIHNPGRWVRSRDGSTPWTWAFHSDVHPRVRHVIEEGFSAAEFWKAAQKAEGTVWVHFSGDSRARFTMMELFSAVAGLNWTAEEIQRGAFVFRVANPKESGCWSRVCSAGGAVHLNLTMSECIWKAHGGDAVSFLDMGLFDKTMSGQVSWELLRYMSVAPLFNDYACMFHIRGRGGGAGVRISYDFRKSFSTSSAARLTYDTLTLSSATFRPDVLVVGPTHDAAYWADALYTQHGSTGDSGHSYHESANVSLDDVVRRVTRDVRNFFEKLSTWHCEVSPHTMIIVLDESIIANAGPVQHEDSTIPLAAMVSTITAENAALTPCHTRTTHSSPESIGCGPWFLQLPIFRMTRCAYDKGMFHDFVTDGIHWGNHPIGEFIHSFVLEALRQLGEQ